MFVSLPVMVVNIQVFKAIFAVLVIFAVDVKPFLLLSYSVLVYLCCPQLAQQC